VPTKPNSLWFVDSAMEPNKESLTTRRHLHPTPNFLGKSERVIEARLSRNFHGTRLLTRNRTHAGEFHAVSGPPFPYQCQYQYQQD